MFKKAATTGRVFLAGVTIVLATALLAGSAYAIPVLQIYIEGSTYDTATETWILSNAGTFNVWVLGDVGAYGTIYDVKLAAAVTTAEIPGSSITVTPIGVTPALVDPVNDPTLSPDGAIPPFHVSNGQDPAHSIYGPGVSYYEWHLGNFTGTSDPIGDYQYTVPTVLDHWGQINVYQIDVTGFSTVHFDTYDHIVGNRGRVKYVFAPFSHDGESQGVPEPGTLMFLGIGLTFVGVMARTRKNLNRR